MKDPKRKECDICHDKIGLYQPWYTVRVRGWIGSTKSLKANPTCLCPNCFNAYKNFLIEREVQECHRQNWMAIKKED